MRVMIKLQRHKAYTYKTEKGEKIEHFKHLLIIPEEALQNLGWEGGQELSWFIADDKLILSLNSTEASKNG